VYARHAIDSDRVSLGHDALEIESIDGKNRVLLRFDPRAARVEVEDRPRGQVSVVARGERVAIGRFVCERERRRFARELRRALMLAA
jgi:uncharacterized membrane protein